MRRLSAGLLFDVEDGKNHGAGDDNGQQRQGQPEPAIPTTFCLVAHEVADEPQYHHPAHDLEKELYPRGSAPPAGRHEVGDKSLVRPLGDIGACLNQAPDQEDSRVAIGRAYDRQQNRDSQRTTYNVRPAASPPE
jgi:hypothetical protein